MTPQLREACRGAVHVLTERGEVLARGRAVLFILSAIGLRRTAAVLSIAPLRWFVELGYRIVAGNRPFFARFMFRRE